MFVSETPHKAKVGAKCADRTSASWLLRSGNCSRSQLVKVTATLILCLLFHWKCAPVLQVSCQIGEDGSVGTVYENVEAKEEARARAAEARLRRDAERERERRRAEDLRRQLSQGSAGEGGASSSGESSPSSSPPPPTTPPHPQHPAAQVQQQQQSPVNRAFTATPTHMQNPVTFFPAGRLSPQHHPQQLPHSLSAHVLPPPPQVSRPSYSPPHHPMALAAKQAMRQNHSYPNFRQHQQQQQQQWIQQQQQQLRQSPVQFPPATTHALMGRGTPSPPMFTAGFLPMQQQQQQQQQQGRPMENPMQTMRNTQELLKSISIQNFGRSSPSSHLMHQSLEYVCS